MARTTSKYSVTYTNNTLYTKGNEFIVESTGEQYKGQYHIVDGVAYTGKPKSSGIKKLIPGTFMNQDIYTYDKKLRFNSRVKLFVQPKFFRPAPTPTDYEVGSIQRYIVSHNLDITKFPVEIGVSQVNTYGGSGPNPGSPPSSCNFTRNDCCIGYGYCYVKTNPDGTKENDFRRVVRNIRTAGGANGGLSCEDFKLGGPVYTPQGAGSPTQGCDANRGTFATFAKCCAWKKSQLLIPGSKCSNSVGSSCNPGIDSNGNPISNLSCDNFDLSLCDQLSDLELLNYNKERLCISNNTTLTLEQQISIICDCSIYTPCPFTGSPCFNANYEAFAGAGSCSETNDPTQPGESPGSGFDINYGSCIENPAGSGTYTCSLSQYDPCKDICASIKDPCIDQYGTSLGLENFPRRKMIGSCKCNDSGDRAGHYNCGSQGDKWPWNEREPPPSPFTDGPTYYDLIKLVKVIINNEEHCLPILCDFGCDEFEYCDSQDQT